MNERSKKKPAIAHSIPSASPASERPGAENSRPLKFEGPAAGLNDRWLVPGICIFLAAVIWMVFGQTLGYEFVRFDDQVYVYENPVVAQGLSLKGIGWAFTHIVACNWHPLTMMSHMLDCQLYGLNAGGHHFTNVLLHTATAILLFLVLRRMTGFLWRSAFVTAVFAIHPLRVESVAWVSERKDVLSGLFFMLTLWAYVRYAQGRSSAGSGRLSLDPRHSTFDYYLVLVFFTLGLLCKPMLVTLPFVLLLLDYWPLGRLTGDKWPLKKNGEPSSLKPQLSTLLLEKLPLLGLAVASCVVTIVAQAKAIMPIEHISLSLRVGNALISYAAYLGQMFWPAGLAVLYPFTARDAGVSAVVLSLVLLAGISAGVFVLRRRCPFFLTGWLWYLIMLAPVIGIVQVGVQARADRYTYLPQIGLYLLLTWGVADLCAGWRCRRLVLDGGAAVILAALIIRARAQTWYWQNSELLFTHTLACTSDNYNAHNDLGNDLLQKGQVDEAMVHFQKALQLHPDFAAARYNLGLALFKKDRVDEAITQYQKVLQLHPDSADTHNDLGNALLQEGKVDEAIIHYEKALQINSDFAKAQNNLGNALLQKGRVDEAIAQYQTALQIKPGFAEARYDLGNALLQKGKVDEAIAQYQTVLQIKPDFAEAHNNLGHALCQKGSVDEGINHYQKALLIKPDYADAHYNLGVILFQNGRADEAIAHYQKALQINPDKVEVLNNLAFLLATCPDARIRNGVQAVQYAEQACELTHYGVSIIVGTLAAAYAEAGRYDDAIAAAQKACALATAAGEQDLLAKNQQLLALFRAHQPYHEAAGKFVPAAP
jgi:tetratricopeptide (TPR) repeat protein